MVSRDGVWAAIRNCTTTASGGCPLMSTSPRALTCALVVDVVKTTGARPSKRCSISVLEREVRLAGAGPRHPVAHRRRRPLHRRGQLHRGRRLRRHREPQGRHQRRDPLPSGRERRVGQARAPSAGKGAGRARGRRRSGGRRSPWRCGFRTLSCARHAVRPSRAGRARARLSFSPVDRWSARRDAGVPVLESLRARCVRPGHRVRRCALLAPADAPAAPERPPTACARSWTSTSTYRR